MKSEALQKARTPKYQELARQLREQVEAGVLKPGDQLPTFARMRAEHGLGQATLERVYDLLEEQRLIVREPGKGTFVAQPRASGGVGVLGLITCKISEQHPYYARLLGGVREVVRQAGWELLLTHDKATIKWEKVDGVLSCTAYPEQILHRLPPGMPHLALLYPHNEMPCVVTDDYQGVRLAVEHLLELGHRRIAYLTIASLRGKENIEQRRLRGYLDALQAADIPFSSSWLHPLRDPFEPMMQWEQLGRAKMQRWLKTDWGKIGCTAILAHNDETAIGVIEALHEAGYKVPQDVSVVGFDGTEIADYFRPRLSTVAVPLHEIGATGARLLLRQIEQPAGGGETDNATMVLPSSVRCGQSSAPRTPSS